MIQILITYLHGIVCQLEVRINNQILAFKGLTVRIEFFFPSKTVTSAVGKSLFEHLVQQGTDDSEEQQNSKIKVWLTLP